MEKQASEGDSSQKLEHNRKTMEENMKNFMTSDITDSIKQAVWNLIMDNLVEASKNKILSEITNSKRMEDLVDNIVHKENAQFEDTVVKKLMKDVVPKVTKEDCAHLTLMCLSDLEAIQQNRVDFLNEVMKSTKYRANAKIFKRKLWREDSTRIYLTTSISTRSPQP